MTHQLEPIPTVAEPILMAGVRAPALAYLSTVAPGSRRTMLGALDTIAASLLPGSTATSFPWAGLRFEHTAAVRAAVAEKYAPATANKVLSALRGVLKACWRLGLMSTDDFQRAADVKNIAAGDRLLRGRALPVGEVRALFAHCAADATPSGRLDAAVLAVLVGAGLRRAEAVALNLADWDRTTAELRVLHGKGRKQRLVPLASGVTAALEAWLEVRGEGAGPLFCPVHRSGAVSIKSMSTQALYARLQTRARVAGIEKFSPHDLRRSFVSNLLDGGADISSVQRLAGHANIQTTARYDRRGEAAKRRAVDLVHVPFVGRAG